MTKESSGMMIFIRFIFLSGIFLLAKLK